MVIKYLYYKYKMFVFDTDENIEKSKMFKFRFSGEIRILAPNGNLAGKDLGKVENLIKESESRVIVLLFFLLDLLLFLLGLGCGSSITASSCRSTGSSTTT